MSQHLKTIMPHTRIKIFHFLNGDKWLSYPFRVGDVVKVKNFGASYTSWTEANMCFTNEPKNPFYNANYGMRNSEILFKIKKVMAHGYDSRCVVCYLEDREKRGIIIGASGLELVRQYPLRKGEKEIIILKKLI